MKKLKNRPLLSIVAMYGCIIWFILLSTRRNHPTHLSPDIRYVFDLYLYQSSVYYYVSCITCNNKRHVVTDPHMRVFASYGQPLSEALVMRLPNAILGQLPPITRLALLPSGRNPLE